MFPFGFTACMLCDRSRALKSSNKMGPSSLPILLAQPQLPDKRMQSEPFRVGVA